MLFGYVVLFPVREPLTGVKRTPQSLATQNKTNNQQQQQGILHTLKGGCIIYL